MVVFHLNDFYNCRNMVTPTAARSPAITAITCGTGDAGADHGHIKAYAYVVHTGAQTLQTTETGSHVVCPAFSGRLSVLFHAASCSFRHSLRTSCGVR